MRFRCEFHSATLIFGQLLPKYACNDLKSADGNNDDDNLLILLSYVHIERQRWSLEGPHLY